MDFILSAVKLVEINLINISTGQDPKYWAQYEQQYEGRPHDSISFSGIVDLIFGHFSSYHHSFGHFSSSHHS